MKNSAFISILILWIFLSDCSPQKSKPDETNVLGLLGVVSNFFGRKGTSSQPAVPEIPDIVLPIGIDSVTPANAATFSLDWTDLGTKTFNGACTYIGDNFGTGNIRIQKILPSTKLVLEVRFSQNVNPNGTLELYKQGNSIPGTVSFPNARTVKFESQDPGEFGFLFPYSANASGFVRATDGVEIPSVQWKFRTNFSGAKNASSSLTEDCAVINDKNRCNVKAVQRFTEEIQSSAAQNDFAYFYSDLFYFDEGGNDYGIFAMECLETTAVTAKAQRKEFWFLETNVTFPDIPNQARFGKYKIDSSTLVDIPISQKEFTQFTVFQK
ncbi:hypothetical protein EHQ76_18580 [Leptospira barantonii]|uniref:Uncharacterized protein n=1 Tax=Leptospira barantonii TaxID=2023184 RepID=A0A5F2AY60_9LEPT|nr:hypothetical protein [Leptospira barantonii]TGL93073.1 hypothetical protein EHQ76_18580 [Leptospira barantonii]